MELENVFLERVYVCTSKQTKLYKIHKLRTGDEEKEKIFSAFKADLTVKMENENDMEYYNQNSLIQDIPYKIDLSGINSDSYLIEFKEAIETLLENNTDEVIKFKKALRSSNTGIIDSFEENEGIKFLIVQEKESLFFLEISRNSVIKNKPVMSLSITEDTTVFNIPKGIQIPPTVTARLNIETKTLFVYDVNRFEKMLTLNENLKAKSNRVIEKFKDGTYKISQEGYKFRGLDSLDVSNQLLSSARAVRRLAKYSPNESQYGINQIKSAVNKLDEEFRVSFNDNEREIYVTDKTAKTFVGIIHNAIVQRLISGDVEITI
ncbi:hypothetical protein [Enterococcus casseliflavus]|uniref:hypothetical protein n=1 Tax=Enterococcus casseliflavus TaxID=37734 RepID=UPI0035DFA082